MKDMLYSRLLRDVIFPLGDRVMGTNFISHLKYWEGIQRLSAAELEMLQLKNLDRMLVHATTKSRYYRDLRVERSSDPVTWLKRFPALNKGGIKQHLDSMLCEPKEGLVEMMSSGSSGIQGSVYGTKREMTSHMALHVLFWEWGGYRLGNSLMQTGMTPGRGVVKRLKDILLRTDYVPAFGMDDAFMLRKLRELQRDPRDHLGGYASSLYLLARTARDHDIRDIRFNSVFSWGDKLFAHYRKLIESQFQTRVYDSYGCTEGLMIAGQKDRDDYYVCSPQVYVEILDDAGNEVPPGQYGKVVVTSLDAFAMPLIRYEVHDLATRGIRKLGEHYELGFPILENIIGRDTDIVVTPGGRNLIVHTFTGIFEFFTQIRQFKVIQRAVDEIEVEYIRGEGFEIGVLAKITDVMTERIGERLNVRYREVDHIPPSPSGKPQIVESTLRREAP